MKALENQRFAVGRAGHDPATYGLKGRATNDASQGVYRANANPDGYRVPSVAQAQAVAFPVDSVVEVVGGTRHKQRGVVLGEARSMYRGVADLLVRFEDGMERPMGPDMLRRIG
jgi:hypothetical protein